MKKQFTAIDAIKKADEFMGKAENNIYAAAYNYRRARELFTGGKFADFVRRESARPYDTVRGLAYAGLLIDYTGGKYVPAADFTGMNVSALKTVFKRACGKFMPADEARKTCAEWLKANNLTVTSSVHAIEAAGKDTGKAAGKDTGKAGGKDTGKAAGKAAGADTTADDATEKAARAEKAAITRDFNDARNLIAAGDCTGKELETLLAVMASCFDAVKTGRKYEAGGKLKALKEARKAAKLAAEKAARADAIAADEARKDEIKKSTEKAAKDAAELAKIEASTAGKSVKHKPAAGDGAAAKAYSKALAADKAAAAGK